MTPTGKERMTEGEVRAWLQAHNMTLRGLARGIYREPSLVSRVIRGQVQSEPVWTEIRQYMADPQGYTRRFAAQVTRARRFLRRKGMIA